MISLVDSREESIIRTNKTDFDKMFDGDNNDNKLCKCWKDIRIVR